MIMLNTYYDLMGSAELLEFAAIKSSRQTVEDLVLELDDEESRVTPAAVVMISIGRKHRIENTSKVDPLVFVETQFGSYIGEDDIIRYEDDYGRHLDNWADCDADLL